MTYSIDSSFGFLISKIKSRLKIKMGAALKPHGITAEQRTILLMLCKYGAMTQKSICDLTDTEPANMAVTLKRLMANDYVERVDHPSDSRAYLINVTNKAKDIEEELISYGVTLTDEMLKGIPEEEQEIALKTLKKIFENVKGI